MNKLKTILLGAAAVALTTTAASAANIQDSTREPVRIRMECKWTNSSDTARCDGYDVPEGKRLVVETMRVDAFLSPSGEVFAKFNDSEEPSASEPVRLYKQAGRHMLYGRHIVAESGTKLNVVYRPAADLRQFPASGTTIIQLKGYLEPAL
jgi:hypothetical protein